ncbi:hypothetical protein [Anaeromyxobacter terrae]|uniref:hypothetical protein n=1 Tax=Anaeromyxobacter terrae TaxID=2925406 RepID=UPI001F574C4C|nr:hypothetical protein [Anaeromyxobacter sp. SG22]
MIRALVAVALVAAAPLARAADPAAEAAQSYRIDTQGTTSDLKAGGKGTLVLAIVPLSKVHVHPQAPLKITLEAQGLTLERTSLGHKDAVDPKSEAPRFEVPFLAAAAGKQVAKAKLDFFICSDQWCVKQTRDVAVPVNVK